MDLAAELKKHVSGDEPEDNYKAAVAELVKALKKGDEAAAAEALKAAVYECMDEMSESETPDEGPRAPALAIMLGTGPAR